MMYNVKDVEIMKWRKKCTFLSPVNEKGRKENKKMITVIYSPSVTENKKQKQDKNIRKRDLLLMRVFALFFFFFTILYLFVCLFLVIFLLPRFPIFLFSLHVCFRIMSNAHIYKHTDA